MKERSAGGKHGGCLLPTGNGPTSAAADSPVSGSVNWHPTKRFGTGSIAHMLTYPASTLAKNQLRAFPRKAGFPLLIDGVFSLQHMPWKWDTCDIISLLHIRRANDPKLIFYFFPLVPEVDCWNGRGNTRAIQLEGPLQISWQIPLYRC